VRCIAVINQKGGCGKTTTAINLAAAFAELGQKTLLVDMDPQSHCALGLAVPEQQVDFTIGDGMMAAGNGRLDAAELVWQVSSRLDLAPSTVALAGIERQLADAPDKDLRLSKVLSRLADRYDLCIIDCPPAVGLLTFNALRAAGEVIIPVETGYFALKGAMKQATTLRVIGERCGHHVTQHILATMYDVRTRMAREILRDLQRHFGTCVLPVPIHYNSKLREAVSFGQPIHEYDPASRGAQDFERLARYLLAHPPRRAQMSSASAGTAADDEGSAEPAQAAPAPAPVNSRAAELVQRAKALAERTTALQQRLADDPDVKAAQSDELREQQPVSDPAAKLQLEEKLARLYGVRVTPQGALFVQPANGSQQIAIAGDFNDWSDSATPMRRNERLNVWECCLPLKPGRYRYRLIVDGRWSSDPHNQAVETNPFGELNSVVQVN
jgi:chromosome partitioning protein